MDEIPVEAQFAILCMITALYTASLVQRAVEANEPELLLWGDENAPPEPEGNDG